MRRQAALLAAGIVAALALGGCSADEAPAPAPSESVAEPSASAEPTEEPPPAEARLQQFADVLAATDVAGQPDGDAVVEALVAAGFDAAAIERSDDRDVQGEPVALMTVAVRIDAECLLGQVGQGAPTSVVVPTLGTGTCLVAPYVP